MYASLWAKCFTYLNYNPLKGLIRKQTSHFTGEATEVKELARVPELEQSGIWSQAYLAPFCTLSLRSFCFLGELTVFSGGLATFSLPPQHNNAQWRLDFLEFVLLMPSFSSDGRKNDFSGFISLCQSWTAMCKIGIVWLKKIVSWHGYEKINTPTRSLEVDNSVF